MTATATLTKSEKAEAPKSRRLSLVLDSTDTTVRFVTEKVSARRYVVKDLATASAVVSTWANREAAEKDAAESNKRAAKARRIAPSAAKTAADVADLDQVTRLNLAKTEAAAKKAWKAAGSKGDAPATPVLDWMNGTPKNERKSRKTGGGSTKRYDAEVTAELVERVTTARATGISFPKLATILNDEGYRGGGWTGPKLYALACRHDVGKLPLVKSVEPKPAKAAAPKKATEPKKAPAKSAAAKKAPSTKSLAAVLPKTGTRKPAAKK